MQDFNPQPLLELVYQYACTKDPRSKYRAVMSSHVHNDDVPEAKTDGLYLFVLVPGRRHTSLKVDALPLPAGFPSGKGLIRTRRKIGDKLETCHFLVPHIAPEAAENWTEVDMENGGQFKLTNFADRWRIVVELADQGPEPYPSGTWVYPQGGPKPVFK